MITSYHFTTWDSKCIEIFIDGNKHFLTTMSCHRIKRVYMKPDFLKAISRLAMTRLKGGRLC